MLRSFRRHHVLLQASHVNIVTIRGSALRVWNRQQQQKTFLCSHASRHDRVLTTSMGLISGGILVTSILNQPKEDGHFSGIIKNLYGDVSEIFALKKGCQFDEPWYEDTNKKAIAMLIGANTIVFGLWRVSFRHAKLHQFMWRHFASSYDAVVFGKRFHTLLTSAFSHLTFPHFGINMFMLWEFGPHVLAPKLLSLEKFMALYLTSAMTSSALSALISKLRGNGRVFSVGASGAVSAVFTVSCLLFPDKRLLLYGLFEMTSAQMLQLYTALNIVGAAFQRNLRVDCVGHLGGQSAGFAFHHAPSGN
ncbi:unnamed protein product [Peronospora farinosa]|uniref:Peptidase S54 rhomboid domain-containing protein n=1 Tax=Peronospora farinosa TaxID=134698 RepID=A0AAV0UGZ9_9STRA|nr:unnamed protein product [Peronospora farinosa]CAI5734556.1 unnamed protein product [Peronospora farinosa]